MSQGSSPNGVNGGLHDATSEGPLNALRRELISRFVDPPKNRWEKLRMELGERVNPIVVKEARQSLHSRQFTISFSLTLIAVAFWTVMAVIFQLPYLYYVPGGMLLLSGYMVILSFPLLLVIPFSAFRSMVAESEERTFELVSISALSAIQIVQGKLFSAWLQIAIYLSALAPCIVITYLLRGVSLSTILNILICTVLLSILLTSVSILVATVSRAKLIQVLANIIMLGGLMGTFFYWAGMIVAILNSSDFDSLVMATGFNGLWIIAATMIVSAIILVCLRCSAVAIDFASENHALALRSRIVLATAIILFWNLWSAIELTSTEYCQVSLYLTLFCSMVAGGFMAGEKGLISPRAQRTLPRSLAGRILLTWFYPGAGLGYIFLTCLVTGVVTAWIALVLAGEYLKLGLTDGEAVAALGVLVWSYFVFYTGLTRLIMFAVPRNVVARVIVAFVIQVVLVAAGTLGSYTIASIANRFLPFEYGWHQMLNIIWTLMDVASTGISMDNSPTLLLMPLLALGVFVLNLVLCGRDVLLVRVGLPPKLQEELNSKSIEVHVEPDPFA